MRAAVLLVAVLLVGCAKTADQGPPTFTFGQSASVQVEVDGQSVPLQATVRLIAPGSLQALEDGRVFVPEAQGKQPFYVRVAYSNTTGRAFTAPVEQHFRPRQSDGRYAVRLDIVSETGFAPCDDPVPPVTFGTLGGGAEACLVVLVDEGTRITAVEWTLPDRSTQAVWTPFA